MIKPIEDEVELRGPERVHREGRQRSILVTREDAAYAGRCNACNERQPHGAKVQIVQVSAFQFRLCDLCARMLVKLLK